ncbi:hypothetical protein F2Q69_00037353 [Brassica cretica]|uniref:Uncharacterized protein n=1 Tax=Brassica cretica TaxID=69181 RepID=A0A8S9SVN2_BRACR|nr:hypothetical protein F2Q69_00037353 [Brassica cretica]
MRLFLQIIKFRAQLKASRSSRTIRAIMEGPDVQIRLRSPLSFFFPTSIRDGELDSDDEHGHDDEAEHDEEDGAECKADRATGRYIRA